MVISDAPRPDLPGPSAVGLHDDVPSTARWDNPLAHTRRLRPLPGQSNTPALHVGNSERFSFDADDGTPLVVHRWRLRPEDRHKTEPTLVLCDGLGCDGYTWPYVLRRFAGERRIIHMQWRGHGDSGVPANIDSVRIAQIVQDLIQALRVFGVEDAIFLGHSMGVPIALESWRVNQAVDRAVRIHGLGLFCGVFEDPIASWHGPYADHAPRPLGNIVMNALFHPLTGAVLDHWGRVAEYWRRLLRTDFAYRTTVLGELNPAYILEKDFRPYLAHLERMDMRVFARLARDMREHSARDVLPTISVPTLVVGGARDKFAPRHIAEKMHAAIPNSELLMMLEGSHAAPLEQPRLIERAIERMLARIAPPAVGVGVGHGSAA